MPDFINELHDNFPLKKLGKPPYFIGIEVNYQSNGYMLFTQSKYIKDILSREHMCDSNDVFTVMLN